MQTHTKTRIDIVIEQAAVARLARLLDTERSVHGYTVLPVHGGSGEHGLWTRDGLISEADGMMLVMCILDSQNKDAVLKRVYAFVENRAGIITVSEVEVVRPDRF
jgi:hypothetical protein